ncbi:hypothetical protein [Dasania marina]|uniref:hypothetical protein n=1 Tax=Dasania marina TaxID=471499 RepID=UPI0030D8BB65
MPIALHQPKIKVGDKVTLKPKSPHFLELGKNLGVVEEVVLNRMGYWDVTVDYITKKIQVESSQLGLFKKRH